jgi:hypothetical protein
MIVFSFIMSGRKYIELIWNAFLLCHKLIAWALLAIEGSNIWEIPHVLIFFNRSYRVE